MSRVYLLLRNNQQQGPYSLEEILQLNLKPFDLVWVEGKSAAWQYPGEIAALKPFVPLTPQPETPYKPISTSAMEINFEREAAKNPIPIQPEIKTAAAKNIFVSMPGNAFQPNEIREPEPVAQKIPENISTEPVAFDDSHVQEDFSRSSQLFQGRSINATEEDYRKWFYQDKPKKTSRISAKDLAVAAFMIAVIGTGIYLITKPSLITKPQEQINQVSQVTTIAPVKQNNTEIQTQTEAVINNEPVHNPGNDITSKPVIEKNALVKNRERVKDWKEEKTKTVSPVLPAKTKEPGETVLLPEENPVKQEQKNAAAEKTAEKKEKEKKSLGTAIKNIFGKNKSKKDEPAPKNETVVLEPPRPATNRQSTKREEGLKSGEEKNSSPVVEETGSNTISDQVELSSNASDNWMMGVSGLKVTLRNRSNSIIQTAMVNVYYYDNQNKQLDRKMIYFNQVPAKGKMTLAAPDNKWADRVEIKLGTVTAKDDRYARD